MKLALMQPYLFPYVGYFQLACLSDIFLFYDDVTYIKGGYINRNKIMTKNGSQLFTLPIYNSSSNTLINNLNYSEKTGKLLSSIKQAYSKSKYFKDVFPLIESVILREHRNVGHLSASSIIEVLSYLNMDFNYEFTSKLEYNRNMSAEDKIYNFCDLYSAETYINTIGGEKLYSKENFSNKGINLQFVIGNQETYDQFNNSGEFISNLSIIDLLMNENKDRVKDIISIESLK